MSKKTLTCIYRIIVSMREIDGGSTELHKKLIAAFVLVGFAPYLLIYYVTQD